MMDDTDFKGLLDDILPSGREYPTPAENALRGVIQDEYEDMMNNGVDDEFYIFSDCDVRDDVIRWLRANRAEFLVHALKNTDLINGSQEFTDALEATHHIVDLDREKPYWLDIDMGYKWDDAQEAKQDRG